MFEGTKGSLLALPLFDFQLTKALDHAAVFYHGHVVEYHLGQWPTTIEYQDTCSPDAQGYDRHQVSMAQVEHQQLAQGLWWIGLDRSHFYLLPIVVQRKFQLPGLFPPVDPMAKGHPRMGQVVSCGVVIDGDQLPSGERRAGQPRQAEIGSHGELQFAFSL